MINQKPNGNINIYIILGILQQSDTHLKYIFIEFSYK